MPRGGVKKYETDEERQAARKKQNAIAQRAARNKTRNSSRIEARAPTTHGTTPDESGNSNIQKEVTRTDPQIRESPPGVSHRPDRDYEIDNLSPPIIDTALDPRLNDTTNALTGLEESLQGASLHETINLRGTPPNIVENGPYNASASPVAAEHPSSATIAPYPIQEPPDDLVGGDEVFEPYAEDSEDSEWGPGLQLEDTHEDPSILELEIGTGERLSNISTAEQSTRDSVTSDDNSIPSQVIAESREAAITAILACLQPKCLCEYEAPAPGYGLRDMVNLLQAASPHSDVSSSVLANESDNPLSSQKPLSSYENTSETVNWTALCTGRNLDTEVSPTTPPRLSFDTSTKQFLEDRETIVQDEFDIDSVIFSPSSLGVFRHDVSWCFRPSFMKTLQREQYVSFPGIDMMENKSLLLCLCDQWECFVFFPHMPLKYTRHGSPIVQARSQHLDDYTMQIWTDQILLPAFDEVFPRLSRQHYPFSFAEIYTKTKVKTEFMGDRDGHSRLDLRLPVSANRLSTLWESIVRRCATVPGTALTATAFTEPVLVISRHNLKLCGTGKQDDFSQVRRNFSAFCRTFWNFDFVRLDHFWLDLGFERIEANHASTLLRKRKCNERWASHLKDDTKENVKTTSIIRYPWAGTSAGSVTVELLQNNRLRAGGLAYCKGYNVNKEQFAVQLKGVNPFQNPLFELLAYTQEHLQQLLKKTRAKSSIREISRKKIISQLYAVKKRLYYSLSTTMKCSYGDRQEFRVSYETLAALPENMTQLVRQGTVEASAHNPYWILRTQDVNDFRIAESNRWILLLEKIAYEASFAPGTSNVIPIEVQNLNSLASTTAARLLRFSLGCLNTEQLPSLCKGKRWVQSRFSNSPEGRILLPEPILQKRQGLNIDSMIDRYGMIWLPYNLGVWTRNVPFFKVDKYPNLDIAQNCLRATLRISNTLLEAKTKEGQVAEFTQEKIREITQNNPSSHASWDVLLTVLVQMCIQKYNISVWALLAERWQKHASLPQHRDVSFFDAVNLSQTDRDGLGILNYKKILSYLDQTHLDQDRVRKLEIAYAKPQTTSRHFPSWSSKLWADRVQPLFAPDPSPNWLRKSHFNAQVQEITSMIYHNVSSDKVEEFIASFRKRLRKGGAQYIHAILRYDYDKQSTLSKASPYNSQEQQEYRRNLSELRRTKWIFPVLQEFDVSLGDSDSDRSDRARGPYDRFDILMVLSRARIPTTIDEKSTHARYPPNMIVDACDIGEAPEQLEELIQFLQEYEEWSNGTPLPPGQSVEQGTSSDEESDWPARPSPQRSRVQIEESDNDFGPITR